jgi:uncharacterized protein YndB with AHSA1/START domain
MPMDARESEQTPQGGTTVERVSDCELVVSRTIHGPARLVFEAWTRAELFQQWWVPKSVPIKLLSCEVDARVGGRYRLVFEVPGAEPMAFFGTYLEVTPPTRLSWTNEEAPDGPLSTVTFEETNGKTLVSMRERYPSKEALDAALESGSSAGNMESFEQLEAFITARIAS